MCLFAKPFTEKKFIIHYIIEIDNTRQQPKAKAISIKQKTPFFKKTTSMINVALHLTMIMQEINEPNLTTITFSVLVTIGTMFS